MGVVYSDRSILEKNIFLFNWKDKHTSYSCKTGFDVEN